MLSNYLFFVKTCVALGRLNIVGQLAKRNADATCRSEVPDVYEVIFS